MGEAMSHNAISTQRRLTLTQLVLASTAYLVSFIGIHYLTIGFGPSPTISIWYPPPALNFVLLLVLGLRFAPLIFVATLITYLWSASFSSFISGSIFALLSTLLFLLAGFCLKGIVKINPKLYRFRDVGWFLLIATLLTPILYAVVAMSQFAIEQSNPWSDWIIRVMQIWARDATGIAFLAPFLLVALRGMPGLWVDGHERYRRRIMGLKPRQVALVLAQFGAVVLVSWLVYGRPQSAALNLTYVIFIPLIWIAVWGNFGRSCAAVLLVNVAIALMVNANFSDIDTITLQFGLMTLTLSTLLISSIVTERRRVSHDLEHAALHDVLTGLPNRALFANRLERAFQRASRYPDYKFAVLYLDFDRFKKHQRQLWTQHCR